MEEQYKVMEIDMDTIVFNPLEHITNLHNCNIENYNEELIEKCIMDLFINPRKILYYQEKKT